MKKWKKICWENTEKGWHNNINIRQNRIPGKKH